MFKAFYAAIYDRITSGAERAGLSEDRHRLLAQAVGATIEIGAGTGVNLAHFPPAVTRLCLVEPDPSMRKRLHRRASGRHVEIVDAPAEALPFPDSSFDTAVVTFALCSVADPDGALAEIAQLCGVPVGTVRSRLHQAKAELGARLLAECGTAPRGDAGWAQRVRASYLSLAGRDPDPYVAMFAPDADIAASGLVVRGRDRIRAMCERASA